MKYLFYALIFIIGACGNGVNAAETGRSIQGKLFEAIQTGDSNAIKTLVKKGAALDYELEWDEEDTTPLGIAAGRGDVPTIKLLVRLGANPVFKHPIQAAARKGHKEAVQFFVDQKVPLSDDKGWTVLHSACWKGHRELALYLLGIGVDINAQDKEYGETALMYAVYSANLALVKDLVHRGANISLQDHETRTALDWAYENPNPEIIAYLKNIGAQRGDK